MPSRVDHDARRREVCDIAGRLIASAGIEAVTVRDVAREAGCSTRIVSHYFRNKHELLLLIFMEFSARSLARCEAAIAQGNDLATALEAVLPLDDERRMQWQVWLSFWGKIAGDPEFGAAQRERGGDMRSMIERMLEVCEGHAKTGVADLRFESERLLTAIVGIATQGIFDPQHWPPERQRRHLAAEIDSLRAARTSAKG